jgi:hypothetical protein
MRESGANVSTLELTSIARSTGCRGEKCSGLMRFCFTPNSRHRQTAQACPLCADIVAKVFLGWRSKILRAADAFYAQRREGPYRFIQNRPRTSLVALKSDAAAEGPQINFREIFRVVRFSTFATESAHSRHAAMSVLSPLSGVKRRSDFEAVKAVFDPTETLAVPKYTRSMLGMENPKSSRNICPFPTPRQSRYYPS